MSIAIDTDIPIPFRTKYPWLELKIGESFLFPKNTNEHTARSGTSAANRKHKPRRFLVKKTQEGFRCWRIE